MQDGQPVDVMVGAASTSVYRGELRLTHCSFDEVMLPGIRIWWNRKEAFEARQQRDDLATGHRCQLPGPCLEYEAYFVDARLILVVEQVIVG